MQLDDFLTDTGEWHCTECGACCKLMHLVPELAFFDRGDGICMHLDDDNKCGIYETRPKRCRIEEAFGNDFDPMEVARTCYLVVCASIGYHREVR